MRYEPHFEPDRDEDDETYTEAASIHESGHAVISRVLNFPAGAVALHTDLDESPFAGYSISATAKQAHDAWGGRKSYNLSATEARACVAAAGLCAEIVWYREDRARGSSDDLKLIARLLKGDDEHIKAIIRYTTQLCSQYRDIIEIIAIILREKLYISGSTLDQLVEVLRKNRGANPTLQ